MVNPSRFINACFHRNTGRPPIWLMRQSGRYLPEYRELRQNNTKNFIEFCKVPELSFKATMIPLKHYALDASIVFSDILVVVDALGLNIQWQPAPHLENPINCHRTIQSLDADKAAQKLHYVSDAIKMIKQHGPSIPCIGFSGSPWTIACYMLDKTPTNRAAERFLSTRSFVYDQPAACQHLLQKLTDIIIEYCCQQIQAGADSICLFDSWGHILSHDNYELFSHQYIAQICQHLNQRYPHIPLILFGRHLSTQLDTIRLLAQYLTLTLQHY